MKYTIREDENGYKLLRHGEPVEFNGGLPTNAELEFWLALEEANKALLKARDALRHHQNKVDRLLSTPEDRDEMRNLRCDAMAAIRNVKPDEFVKIGMVDGRIV